MGGSNLMFGNDEDPQVVLGQDYEILGEEDDYDAEAAELFEGDEEDDFGEDDDYDEDDLGEDYEILGARGRRRSRGRSRGRSRMRRRILSRNAKVVTRKAPRREYEQVLPVTSTAIASLAVRDISLNPQRPFRPEKFRVSSTHTAPFFVITAYSIGQDNQFVGPGSIPVDLFSEVALYSQIRAYTANLGNLITLTVQNIDTDPHDFRGAFFGTALGN